MSTASLFRLIALSAIWGASFLFIRISAPVLGPIMLMALRFAAAASFLLLITLLLRRKMPQRAYWKSYVFQGLVGATIPFFMFGYAAQTLPASTLAILNATAPIWGALLGAVFGRHRMTLNAALGLALGVAGVGVLVGFDASMMSPHAGMAVAAVLGATLCYSIVTLNVKRELMLDPLSTALGTMAVSALAVAPMAPFFWPAEMPSLLVTGSALTLGVVCSGLAYLMYFRLIADVGPAPALTVTFLIPVFGVLWGALFLGESVGWHTLAGSLITITGTALVTGFRPRWPWRKKEIAA